MNTREIKFKRLYYYPDDGSSSWVKKQIMPNGNWKEEFPIGPFEEKSPWLQFTGLKDSQGREIYDGDIVTSDEWSGPCVVTWNNENYGQAWVFSPVSSDGYSPAYYYGGWDSGSWGIIGNIYENPELLKP